MTMHQGQGHQNEHEHICHVQVDHHAKFGCHILNKYCPRYGYFNIHQVRFFFFFFFAFGVPRTTEAKSGPQVFEMQL